MSKDVQRMRDDIKGGIAETLVTMLFRRSGYAVKIHGEWKAVDLNPDTRSPLFRTTNTLPLKTDHPDLIISEKGRKQLLEVKYRKKGRLLQHWPSNHLLKEQCLEWGDVDTIGAPFSVIIVNEEVAPHFTVLQAPYLSESGWFIKRLSLMEAGWDLRQDLHDECVRLIQAGLFKGVNS